MAEIQLTQYSHGGGCGCKIAPGVLEQILSSQYSFPDSANLLVGNNSKDDAAVYDLQNGTAVISTTDFFMPIVNDPFDFGKIASANAISDVYAMGGKPLMAIAILGWPVDKLSTDVARRVIEGGRSICAEAGIPLAGGHSIDAPEPIFGLAVTGLVELRHLKQNNTARAGDYLYLTKKLGVGICSTAQKRNLLTGEDGKSLIEQLTKLNAIGEALGKLEGVHAMTDITGFGLLGHLAEVAKGSGLSAELYCDKIKLLPGTKSYLKQKVIPGATMRNWNSISNEVSIQTADATETIHLLADPQTNGGLLIAVAESSANEVTQVLQTWGYHEFLEPIGRLLPPDEQLITVLP